jgi:hypothetical protein
MAYQPNSIGRTMAGELFMTDEQAVAHLEGTEEFDRCWKLFLSEKRTIIRTLSPVMTVDQKYNIIYPDQKIGDPVRSQDFKQQAVNDYISIWCGCIGKAGMEL